MKYADEPMRTSVPQAGGITPVPNHFLDGVMPGLRDTELRVLLVVVRQTLGWQEGPDPKQRKERDWMTQSQLMRRTGRASGAVSRAVDALRAGLIDVLDRAGAPLGTAAQRRRHLGRLYYRLHADKPVRPASPQRAKREHAKPNTTKESKHKIKRAAAHPVDNLVDKSRREARPTPLLIRTKGWERIRKPGELSA